MKIKAYAKINLSLDVTGRREDGFHTLDTVMQSVALYDEVELKREKEPGVRLRCSKDYLPTDKRNTAYRAAQFFLEHCGITEEGVSLSIRKRIPSRAGMGGGSADAAAVLLGLDQLFETHLGLPALMELGAKVGADVPFCVHGGTCRCTGIGEVVEPVAPMPHCYLAICKPPAGMSTPRAYALLDDYPQTRNFGTPRMLSALEKGDLGRVAATLSNRFDETMRGPGRHDDRQRLGGVRPVRHKREGRKLPGRAGGPGQAVPLQPLRRRARAPGITSHKKQTQAAERSAACLLFFRLFSRLHPEGGGHLCAPLGAVPQGQGAPVLFAQQLADGEPQPKVGAAGPLGPVVGFGGALQRFPREAVAVIGHGEAQLSALQTNGDLHPLPGVPPRVGHPGPHTPCRCPGR